MRYTQKESYLNSRNWENEDGLHYYPKTKYIKRSGEWKQEQVGERWEKLIKNKLKLA